MSRLFRSVRTATRGPGSRWVHVVAAVFAAFVLMSAGSSGVTVSASSVFLVLFWLALADLAACVGLTVTRHVLNR